MLTCELSVIAEGSERSLGHSALPEGFLHRASEGAAETEGIVSLTVTGYQKPVPEGLCTVELAFDALPEMVLFVNGLLPEDGGSKAAVLMIRGPCGSQQGFLLPPGDRLFFEGKQVQLSLGLDVSVPLPVPEDQTAPAVADKRKAASQGEISPNCCRRQAAAEEGGNGRQKDTPELSVARRKETQQLRQDMADLVRSLGPLNTLTKAGRLVARDGYIKGLAAMYGRWVFNQKAVEGNGPDFDPLLPSSAPVDNHQLPKELIEAGMSSSAALQVSTTLSELSCRAARRLIQLSKEHVQRGPVQKVAASDGTVELSYANTTVIVADDHYNKLSNLWELNGGTNGTKDEDIFCVLQRYEALSGASPGFQMALPEDVFDVLHKHWEVVHECFASPLNCYFPSYCSLFPDTDSCFGSKGSFFGFSPTEGSFEANPPFVEDTMTNNVRHMFKLLDASSSPLSFVVVVPGWDDDSCKSYQLTTGSPFLKGQLRLHEKDHFYKNGMQHRMQGQQMYQQSRCATFLFFLQNEAGAARWPVTQRRLDELRHAFCSESQPRAQQGHRDIIGQASKSWYEDL